MRTHYIVLVMAIVIFPTAWTEKWCVAQDKPAQPKAAVPQAAQPAKPQAGKPQPADAAPVVIEAVPRQAGVAIPAMRLVPAMGRATRNPTDLPFDLSNLVLAKFDESPKGPQLVALMDQTRAEQKTVTVTRIVQEVRTRKIKITDKDGKESEVDQEYTVAIPVTENVEQTVQVPAGKKPTVFPFDELRIYRLDGTKVALAEVRKQLEKMSPVFLLRGFTGDIKAVEGVYLQALSPNCLIVVTEK